MCMCMFMSCACCCACAELDRFIYLFGAVRCERLDASPGGPAPRATAWARGDGARLPARAFFTRGRHGHECRYTAGPPSSTSTPLPPSGPPLGNSLRLSGLSLTLHPSSIHLSSGLTHGPRSKRGTSCSCSHPCPVSPALASIVEVLIDSRPGSSCCPHAPGPDGARTRR